MKDIDGCLLIMLLVLLPDCYIEGCLANGIGKVGWGDDADDLVYYLHSCIVK